MITELGEALYQKKKRKDIYEVPFNIGSEELEETDNRLITLLEKHRVLFLASKDLESVFGAAADGSDLEEDRFFSIVHQIFNQFLPSVVAENFNRALDTHGYNYSSNGAFHYLFMHGNGLVHTGYTQFKLVSIQNTTFGRLTFNLSGRRHVVMQDNVSKMVSGLVRLVEGGALGGFPMKKLKDLFNRFTISVIFSKGGRLPNPRNNAYGLSFYSWIIGPFETDILSSEDTEGLQKMVMRIERDLREKSSDIKFGTSGDNSDIPDYESQLDNLTGEERAQFLYDVHLTRMDECSVKFLPRYFRSTSNAVIRPINYLPRTIILDDEDTVDNREIRGHMNGDSEGLNEGLLMRIYRGNPAHILNPQDPPELWRRETVEQHLETAFVQPNPPDNRYDLAIEEGVRERWNALEDIVENDFTGLQRINPTAGEDDENDISLQLHDQLYDVPQDFIHVKPIPTQPQFDTSINAEPVVEQVYATFQINSLEQAEYEEDVINRKNKRKAEEELMRADEIVMKEARREVAERALIEDILGGMDLDNTEWLDELDALEEPNSTESGCIIHEKDRLEVALLRLKYLVAPQDDGHDYNCFLRCLMIAKTQTKSDEELDLLRTLCGVKHAFHLTLDNLQGFADYFNDVYHIWNILSVKEAGLVGKIAADPNMARISHVFREIKVIQGENERKRRQVYHFLWYKSHCYLILEPKWIVNKVKCLLCTQWINRESFTRHSLTCHYCEVCRRSYSTTRKSKHDCKGPRLTPLEQSGKNQTLAIPKVCEDWISLPKVDKPKKMTDQNKIWLADIEAFPDPQDQQSFKPYAVGIMGLGSGERVRIFYGPNCMQEFLGMLSPGSLVGRISLH